jgi:ADP-ribosylglycohydrolase
MGALIYGAIAGETKDVLLGGIYSPNAPIWDDNPLVDEVNNIALGSYKDKSRDDIESNAYVINSLEAALWAFHNSESFAEGMLVAVNLGEDADTTGAIYGQLAGTYYGVGDIPEEWMDVLCKRDKIVRCADSLLQLSEQI